MRYKYKQGKRLANGRQEELEEDSAEADSVGYREGIVELYFDFRKCISTVHE